MLIFIVIIFTNVFQTIGLGLFFVKPLEAVVLVDVFFIFFFKNENEFLFRNTR